MEGKLLLFYFSFARFAELLEDVFTIPFAIQMLIVTVEISITLLQVCIYS